MAKHLGLHPSLPEVKLATSSMIDGGPHDVPCGSCRGMARCAPMAYLVAPPMACLEGARAPVPWLEVPLPLG